MNGYLLIDFGSTFTKVCSIDIDSETILGTAQAPTSVNIDITNGLKEALSILERKTGHINYTKKLACSSAAGGLSVIASGLVESLTLKAARLAALGAGAKVTHSFHHQLTASDLKTIEENIPDIFLLSGGTDGGNSEVLLHNAQQIAKIEIPFTVVFAGNRTVAEEAENILVQSGKDVRICPNIMPSIDRLNIEPVNEVIRELFLDRITEAKGIKKAEKVIDGILMPTPYAVLLATALLADGTEKVPGLGELMVIDTGGATTDVHSVCGGYRQEHSVVFCGITEPRVKRTVEGDLGVRHNAASIINAIGADIGGFGLDAEKEYISSLLGKIKGQPSILFNGKDREFDAKLCKIALDLAVKRHCGTLEKHYTPRGVRYLQYGKDLTGIKTVIGTGGPLLNATEPAAILSGAFFKADEPDILRPTEPNMYLDRRYIMFAMGLLSTVNKDKALRIMIKEIIEAGAVEWIKRAE